MRKPEDGKLGADAPESPMSLTDEDITTVRVDRRSFSRARSRPARSRRRRP